MLQKAVDGVSSGMATNVAASATAQSLLADRAFTRGTALAFVFYGATRALSVVASEIKTCLFASVSQNALRKFAHQIFTHLHTLDTDFHLRTPSGTVSVAYVRAVRGFQTLLFQIIFSVAPTIIELALVSNVLFTRYGPLFSAVTLVTFLSYLCYTVWITEWRVALRREMVETDNARNGFFIDSILNQEMVKLFTNEAVEAERY
jgi:ABC-type transport system involved in Fe-S cluster assembly fused permease/ATPase subunit